MTFSLYFLLIIYSIFFVVWLIFSLVAIYHMLRFGFLDITTFFMTFIFIAVSAVILFYSSNFFSQIDWTLNVSMFESASGDWFNLNLQ